MDELEYFLDELKMLGFVFGDMVESIFEMGRNLWFLREYYFEYFLVWVDVVELMKLLRLEFEFEWEVIVRLEGRVEEYRGVVERVFLVVGVGGE